MRDPGRSEYSFVPHKYIHSTPILSPTPGGMDFEIGAANETTPINARQHAVEHARPVHYSAFMYWLTLIVSLSFVCVEWVLLYPLSPSRLYNIQVDMFDGRVNHAEFFFQQILPLGMLLGSLITFKLADRLGRATMLELAAIPYVLGWLFVGVAFGQVTLLVGRYCLGVAISVFSIVVPILLAEVSEDDSRGRVLTASQLVRMLGGRMVYIGVGQFFVYLSTCYVSFNLSEWKIIATIGVAPGLLLLVCMQFVPDTPSWLLLRHNDRVTSFSVCLKIQSPVSVNRSTRAEVRVNSILHADFLSTQAAQDDLGRAHQNLGFSRPLRLTCGLYALQAIAATILEPSLYPTTANTYAFGLFGIGLNLNEWNQLVVSYFLAGAAALGLVAASFVIDSQGRVQCLKLGTGVVAASALLLLLLKTTTSLDAINDTVLDLNEAGSALVLLMTAGHYIGLGLCPLVIASEIFPARRRVAGVSVVVLAGSATSLAVGYLINCLRSSSAVTSQVLFQGAVGAVGVVNVVALVVAVFFVPETKSRSLQEIEAILSGYAPITPPNIRSKSYTCEAINDSFSFELGHSLLIGMPKPNKLRDPVTNLRPNVLCIRKAISLLCIAHSQRYKKAFTIFGIDLSRAFDTIDHEKLLQVIEQIVKSDELRLIRMLHSDTTIPSLKRGAVCPLHLRYGLLCSLWGLLGRIIRCSVDTPVYESILRYFSFSVVEPWPGRPITSLPRIPNADLKTLPDEIQRLTSSAPPQRTISGGRC
ncbi:hypothetical protein DYB37_011475 [Aphanomyces astaci]|uniref:Major facilitator superfamily (MFS) profile domain-containing protein n=1 Tax=Aphanomyces astaci TaxID=112090 RepID=A0A3R6Y180_APHAT|nr:hypothetical protein DYB37_011475 [Aphanomyces astaci]